MLIHPGACLTVVQTTRQTAQAHTVISAQTEGHPVSLQDPNNLVVTTPLLHGLYAAMRIKTTLWLSMESQMILGF